jgi:hypothetical protein
LRRLVNILVTTAALAAASCGESGRPERTAQDRGQSLVSQGAQCVEGFSPQTLRNRAFAFDGTVRSIELRRDPKLELEGEEDPRIPWVTFSVHRWYRGGSGDEVGVWIEFLNVETSEGTIRAERGTRLLVAGEPRWGGAPLKDAIAWPCGFTQPYARAAADRWEAAFRT